MRLGGPIFEKYESPTEWVSAVQALGYRSALCPVDVSARDDLIRAYEYAAIQADIVIAEVGVWNNPLSPDDKIRKEAVEKCKRSLALADEIGARCCVNIAGSRGGERWDGPSYLDLTPEAFDMIVETVRNIVDSVKPKRSFYTLEPMPWMYPNSTQSYLDLIQAIDRKSFAVHFDPVNLITNPEIYFNNAAFIKDFIAKLGPYIKSCHVKDIVLENKLTVHLQEVRPGLGTLDHGALLKEIAGLSEDIPILIEHLPYSDEYAAAADHLRSVAKREGLSI